MGVSTILHFRTIVPDSDPYPVVPTAVDRLGHFRALELPICRVLRLFFVSVVHACWLV